MKTHIFNEITEIQKFILYKELLTQGNMEKLPVPTKEVRKFQNMEIHGSQKTLQV